MFSINENCLNQIKNMYEYKGLYKLEKNFDNILNSNKIDNFYICSYRVNNNNLYPFLDFLLKNDLNTNMLSFPSLNPEGSSSSIISKITNLLFLIYSNIELDDKYEYKGSYYYNNNIYLFFDFTNCKLNINSIYKKSNIWAALVDEIINKKNVCNIKINSDITNFFNKNIDFIILEDKNKKMYEIPSVTYVGKKEEKLSFTYIFGMSKPDNNLLFGNYYYFTDFKNAINQFIEGNKKGIVRFALFTGVTKVILNNITDLIDESDIKREIINSSNNLYENLTLRITDYDGTWAEKHDSVYIGEVELDNGEKMQNTPIYVVKKYEQQIPLSYHYIDPNKDYQIS